MRQTASESPVRAAIYCRISADSEGERLGVARQEEDCRARAEREGIEVVDLYVDNDISASTKSRKARPDFTRMMADARAGRFDVILAYSNSRLTRRPRELEDLIDHHARFGTRFLTIVSGDDDLSTAAGRRTARIKASVDAGEAEEISERARRKKKQMADQGRYRGGMRPYGYESDGVTIREDEAKLIREASAAVLAGRTLASVARELSEVGARTSRGKEWTYGRLRDVLVRPRNAGLLSKGRADRNEHEILGQAQWDALVDEDTWRAVHTLLTDPARRKQDGNAPTWLGSGIYTCGVLRDDGDVCGTPLRAAPYGGKSVNKEDQRYLYRCTASAHLTISVKPTDKHVREKVADLVRDPRVVAALHPADLDLSADREKRAMLAARLEAFETDYALGRITGEQLQKATTRVAGELTQVDVRIADGLQRTATSPIVGAADPGEAFLSAPVDVQRAVLRSVLRVEVRPAANKGVAWSSGRLRLSRPGKAGR